MKKRPSQDIIEEVALLMALEPSYVEKDWYVTQVIALLNEISYKNFKLVFTGGTALAKAHRLIKRMSEDCDFRIIVPNSAKSRKELSNFKHFIIEHLRKAKLLVPEVNISARNENQYFSIEIDYETYFARLPSLRPHIQLEFSVRASQIANCNCSVSSFINELSKEQPEVLSIDCISPIENAADKLSAITWRIADRVRSGLYDDPSIVRHIHDLAILGPIAAKSSEFSSLVYNSMQADNNRSKNNLDFPNQPLQVKFKQMLDILKSDKEYKREYKHFVESMSYAQNSEVPSFESALKVVKLLIKKVLKEIGR